MKTHATLRTVRQVVGVCAVTAACWGVNTGFGQTIADLTTAAKKDPAAMYQLGLRYFHGQDIDANPKEAYAWFKKAAAKDSAPGIHMVGFCLANGIGVTLNEKEAFKNYLKAAEADITEAQLAVAHSYASGTGVPKNEAEALRWYTKLAEKGSTEMEYIVGRMNFDGQGTSANYNEGVKWFRKAADKGYGPAQLRLGGCYVLGQGGVPRDSVESLKWVILASELGDEDAVKRRNDFAKLYRLTDEQVADARKRAAQFVPKSGSQ